MFKLTLSHVLLLSIATITNSCETCGRNFLVLFRRYKMCNTQKQREICTPFRRLRVERGYECGACRIITPTSSHSPIECPSVGRVLDLDELLPQNGIVNITTSKDDSLCSLWLVSETDGRRIPVARSYLGNNWESYSGEYARQQITCNGSICTTQLPYFSPTEKSGIRSTSEGKFKYQLVSSQHSLSEKDSIARFLEQATFGPTRADIEFFGGSAAKWIQRQQRVPLSSHRQLFREHWTHGSEDPSFVGIPTHACHEGTRYRRYAFSDMDRSREIEIRTDIRTGRKILLVDDQARTVINASNMYSGDPINNDVFGDGSYPVCGPIAPKIGSLIRLVHPTTKQCKELYADDNKLRNPVVYFDDLTPPTNPLVDLNSHGVKLDNNSTDSGAAEHLYIARSLSDPACPSFPAVTGLPVFAVIGSFEGDLWIHDPSFDLLNNTVESPSLDGGGENVMLTQTADSQSRALCSSAPMTFLNEDSCLLSSEASACGAAIVEENAKIDLVVSNFEKVYEASAGTRLVFAVTGLRQSQADASYRPPCSPATRSRWKLADTAECSSGGPGNETVAIFSKLISSSTDENQFVKDIYFPAIGVSCDIADVDTFGLRLLVDGKCWQNIHRADMQVYDFSEWTIQHPGGATAISQYATKMKGFLLSFPQDHDMTRWNLYADTNLVDLGRLGDQRLLNSAPEVAEAFQEITADPHIARSAVLCGSPGEVANRKDSYSRGGDFDAATNLGASTPTSQLKRQKQSVWMDIALNGEDQLRQRVAWILSQILVITPADAGTWFATERFTAYFDIFVRNAFGNYRNVLKEVSYSPMMGSMLSYRGSKSTLYSWSRKKRVEFADENYAREVMQLFSIGLNMLNNNGTNIVNEDGSPIQTYSNDDIAEYARLWTGLKTQARRGNIEIASKGVYGSNFIDPMQIGIDHDVFPKMGLRGWYVGDGLPLCADLPRRHFLKKGATYRLLGSLPKPIVLREPGSWANDSTVKRLFLRSDSLLRKKLCNKTDPTDESCNYRATIELDEDLPCSSTECEVDSPRIIEVEPGLFYEYTRIPCVNQAFFDSPKLLKRNILQFSCEDPRTASARVACCEVGSNLATTKFELFAGERMAYATAEERCASNGLEICSMPNFDCGHDCDRSLKAWTNEPCAVMAKINLDGKVGIVHGASHRSATASRFSEEVREDTKTYFRVHWSASVQDNLLSNYETKCSEMGCGRDSYDNLCLCPVRVTDEVRFSRAPSVTEVLDELYIGSFEPHYILEDNFETTDFGNGVRMHSKGGVFSPASIFEVVDSNGIKQWRKNTRSTVTLGNESLSFRNPPNMMSINDIQPRDGYYEIDAGVDHYFYHQNTAPFLGIRFAQRFGISNPTPRFIDVIATAFRTGYYRDSQSGISFGAGSYGDLSAMVAAVLLDRESRSEILDVDPTHGSLQEPFLKLVRVMRSLEFETDEKHRFTHIAENTYDRIGQESYSLPSVFSFFLPDFIPDGPIGDSGLVCPECLVLTGPKSIGMVNGLLSLVKYGLDSAYEGFASNQGGDEEKRKIGSSAYAEGSNTLVPLPTDSARDVVDELARLLTSGRILEEKRSKLIDVYEESMTRGTSKEALINIQQLIMTMPEFHTNSISKNDQQVLQAPLPPEPSTRPYKAVIRVNLAGGMDSFNLLVPQKCNGKNSDGVTVDQQYNDMRGNIAFTASERSMTIDVDAQWGQPCSVFAIHDEMSLLKELYDAGDLIFFANTGVLAEANSTKDNYRQKNRMNLFAHNTMQREASTADPLKEVAGTGVLGRLGTVLKRNGHNVNSVSIDDPSDSLSTGTGAGGPLPKIISRSGVTKFGRKPASETLDVETYLTEMNAGSSGYSSFFGETWSSMITQGIHEARELEDIIDSADELGSHWPSDLSTLSEKFQMIARFINTHRSRGTDRDIFDATFGGFDHHSDVKTRLRNKFHDLNEDLRLLTEELKHQGMWDNVIIVVTSEFGRTITENSGGGTDHGWGGNYWMMGGDVDGRKVLGQYPNDLTEKSPLNIGRGRVLPTTSWDAIWNGVSEWMGVDSTEDKDYCLPGRKKSTGRGFTELIPEDRLFIASRRKNRNLRST